MTRALVVKTQILFTFLKHTGKQRTPLSGYTNKNNVVKMQCQSSMDYIFRLIPATISNAY